MKAFISLLLIAGLATCALCNEDCDNSSICPPEETEVCVLHSTLYCFIRYENISAWNKVKDKFNLDFKEFDLKFCDLENFMCARRKRQPKLRNDSSFNA